MKIPEIPSENARYTIVDILDIPIGDTRDTKSRYQVYQAKRRYQRYQLEIPGIPGQKFLNRGGSTRLVVVIINQNNSYL